MIFDEIPDEISKKMSFIFVFFLTRNLFAKVVGISAGLGIYIEFSSMTLCIFAGADFLKHEKHDF